ncbi:MAG: imelysin family protein [Anaerolineales bacterium]|nr:imelysin family protein [Anaerolineales bacterium]
MKIARLSIVLLVGVATITLAIINQPSAQPTQAESFDRRAMLENITLNVVLPYHQALAEQAAILQEAIYAFRDNPNAETLSAAQDAWVDTSVAWERCEWLEFGRLMLYHTPIERLPTSVDNIETVIAGDHELTSEYLYNQGSSIKGLPALEYLLFSAGDDTLTSFQEPRRMAYLVALAETLAIQTQELYDTWSPEGDNYAETFIDASGEGTSLRESISMLNNQMVVEIEAVLRNKLARPLGLSAEDNLPRPEQVEAPYSDASTAQIIANLEGLQGVFNGGEGLGFDDYLDFLGAEYEGDPLSAAINARFEAALTAMHAIEQPLQIAIVEDPETVRAAYESMRALMVLVRVDMAGQLGVTITFNDNDGD